MEKFNFDYYKDSIKRIKCFYTYNNTVEENTFWEGYIFVQNIDGVLNIEGYEKDNMDSLEKSKNPHLRYILGKRAISYATESLVFEIYPGNIAPIHYDMHYNKDDECFYGKWFFSPSTNHPQPHRGNGEAIISIEDVIVEEKEIMDIIKKIAYRSRQEYSEEIETLEFLSQSQILLSSDNNYSPAAKKLSRFSKFIK